VSAPVASPLVLIIVGVYLALLIGLGLLSRARFRGTSRDYFVAERSIGPFVLLMSIFGTTMTAFALVGSTGAAFDRGIGVYGLMASSSGIIHSLIFFLIGIRLWAIGKRHEFLTQIQYFRARFESPRLGYVLFPILVSMVLIYLLIGILGAGAVLRGITVGMFPATFPGQADPVTGNLVFVGAVPPWITGGVICLVVLFYVFSGGVRAAAWANTFQTLVFMVTGVITFFLITRGLGGLEAATAKVMAQAPDHLTRTRKIGHLEFLTYGFVPLSVGMFPHLFQHWLTATNAKAFRLTAVCHPLFILIVWAPCILMGIWAAGMGLKAPGGNTNVILPRMVSTLVESPWLMGIVVSGVLAAIMSTLDSQFVCLGTMFTQDIVIPLRGGLELGDDKKLLYGRGFTIAIVVVCYLISLRPPANVFDLGVWSFSGFAGLFPLVVAAVYWRRATRAGAFACVLAMAATWGGLFWYTTHTGQHGEILIGGMMPVTFVIGASATALVLVSLVTRPPDARHVDRFVMPRR
jgi:SSS family solute:Na+ symporter